MKSLSIVLLASSLFIFASCSQDKPVTDTPAETSQTIQSESPAAQPPATTNTNMPVAAPNSTAPAQQPAAAGGDVALNPAHGQPNHRCDIAVGAPLNSAPTQQPQTIKVP